MVGETPNLAARLQALAAPGTVVVAASTRRLLGALFELTDLGAVHLKGFAQPLAAFQVVGEGCAEGRFEALARRLPDAAGRSRARARHGARALGVGQAGPRSGRHDLRRAGNWQIQDRAGAARAPRQRAAHRAQPFLLALSYQHHAPSDHHPAGAGGGLHARGRAGDQARQAGRAARAVDRRPGRGGALDRRAARRPERRSISRLEPHPATAEAAHAGSPDRAAGRPRPQRAGARRVRGRALGGPVEPGAAGRRGRADPHPASPRGDHLSARIHPALVGRDAPHLAAAQPSRPTSGGRHARAPHRQQGASRRGPRPDPGSYRRRAAVRRGADQDGVGVRACCATRAIIGSSMRRCCRSPSRAACTTR